MDALRQQLGRGLSGLEIELFGIKVGDPAEKIPTEMIRSYEAHPTRAFRFEGSRRFSRDENGNEIEATDAALRQWVLGEGGKICCDGLVISVAGGLVSCVSVQALLFNQLALATEADVLELLGAPEAKQVINAGFLYLYPSRHLSVSFGGINPELRFGRLELPEDEAVERGYIVLHNYRTIVLQDLEQSGTYDGLIEGLPTREGNQQMLARLAERVEKKTGNPVYIVPPEEKRHDTDDFSLGTPASLPSRLCIGTFQSGPTAEPYAHFSLLTIVWFQADWAFPIDDAVRQHIRGLNWAQLAENGEY